MEHELELKINEILNKLNPNPLDKLVWVGKNYSKRDMIGDLLVVLTLTSNKRQ